MFLVLLTIYESIFPFENLLNVVTHSTDIQSRKTVFDGDTTLLQYEETHITRFYMNQDDTKVPRIPTKIIPLNSFLFVKLITHQSVLWMNLRLTMSTLISITIAVSRRITLSNHFYVYVHTCSMDAVVVTVTVVVIWYEYQRKAANTSTFLVVRTKFQIYFGKECKQMCKRCSARIPSFHFIIIRPFPNINTLSES